MGESRHLEIEGHDDEGEDKLVSNARAQEVVVHQVAPHAVLRPQGILSGKTKPYTGHLQQPMQDCRAWDSQSIMSPCMHRKSEDAPHSKGSIAHCHIHKGLCDEGHSDKPPAAGRR